MTHNYIADGFLDWNCKCDSLVQLMNSTTYTKLFLDSRIVNIGKLERVMVFECTKAPGTVVMIDENVLHVAAADGIVRISDFLDENDQPIAVQKLANQNHIIEGGKLPVLTPEQSKWFEMVYTYTIFSKPYNFLRIAKFQPSHIATQKPTWTLSEYQKTSKDTIAMEVLVAWLIYIARDIKLLQFQIGWDAAECYPYNNDTSLPTDELAKTVLFETFIDVNDTFSGVMASVEKYYEQLLCLPKALIRHVVKTIKNGKDLCLFGVSLRDKHNFIAGANELPGQVHGSLMTLQINKQCGAFRWIYDKTQISEKEVNRISLHLLILLADAKNKFNAKKAVAKLNLLPKCERELLLYSWNQMVDINLPVCCLHQLFEVQMESNEQAIAVECKGNRLSYSELNSKANLLAYRLIAQGVKPDNRIALCVERSTTMIVAILGILKAGCAYVPLDPVYASQRLTNILLDADPLVLLTDVNGRIALGEHQIPVIDLEKPLDSVLQISNPDITQLGLSPAHLAYVIYTSGSTGEPKGVMIEHQHVAQYFEAIQNKFDFKKQDKWCLFHSVSFDFSVWEIWGALLQGSQLSIVPHNIISSANELYDWICTNVINILGQTPSAFKNLLRAENFSLRSDQLSHVFVGGEALDPMIVSEWYDKYNNGKTMLSNSYGPTETTVDATVWIYDVDDPKSSVSPIGRPLSNKRIYLLDSFGEPVLLGTEGEIHIGGAGVARGYLNRPKLTAERFLLDPFSEIPAERMYRTGDLARYLPDGNLVFLGRVDQQVKIRGFRIELGEIEARLVEHPDVHEAVVQAHGNGSNTRLVAYVVADDDPSLAQNLRTYLLNLLPNYMVPAAYMCLSSLPLTASGKLDRRALPVLSDEAFARKQYETPHGEIEVKLADIWRELLGIDCISRHDNFFELGGHSLLVVHFVKKAKLHKMNIDTRGVFSYPILMNLAEQITKRTKRFYCCDSAIPVRQFGNEAPLFLLPDGGGDISYAFELARDINENIPVYVLPWPSPENKQPSSLEEMAKEIVPLIKKVKPNGPCGIAGYSNGGILGIEITKQLTRWGYPVLFLGLIDTYANIVDPLSETEFFLQSLRVMYPNFIMFHDTMWLNNLRKLTLSDAIAEICKTNIIDNLDTVDIEWQTLLLKQCYNYQNLCASYKIDTLPMKTHLFKAENLIFEDVFERNKLAKLPKLGWETLNFTNDFNVITVDGDHLTMMKNPTLRRVLGEKLTKSLMCSRKA